MNLSLVTAVVAYLVAAFPSTPLHPHHPKAIVVGGAAGKITVSYFTVPFNADHLKDKPSGFQWHLGGAQLNTEVPLRVGDVDVPAGDYSLNARLDDQGAWNFVLQDKQAAAEIRQAGRRARNSEAARAKYEELKEAADKAALVLIAKDFKMVHEEHLDMVAINNGYVRIDRASMDPASGVEFALRVSFGDLHRELKITEEFEVGTAVEASDKKVDKKKDGDD